MHTVHRSTLPVYVDSKAKFPNFSLPMLVGYFSLDSDRQFHADTSQLRYVYFPRHNENLAWDLNIGLQNVQRAGEAKNDEGIDHLLRGILASGISLKPEVAGFVCFRGLFTTIMTTPYEQSQGWEILVSKFKGILFMCARETDEKKKQRMAETARQKRFSSWGYKFEQFLMTETPNQEPDVQKPVKEAEEFCCLFRTKLNNHRLLFGAEMDGVRSKEPLQNSLSDLAQAEFVELKTSRRFDNLRQERNFKRYKLLKWWAQSFLVGIKNIVCGFRDDHGIVDNIRFYPLQEIPKMAKNMWVPAVCMTFLDQFLTFVETTVNHSNDKNDPHTVWRFRWEPGVQVVTVDEFPGHSNFTFLPEWFLSTTTTVDHLPLQSFVPTNTVASHSMAANTSSSHERTTLEQVSPNLFASSSSTDHISTLLQTDNDCVAPSAFLTSSLEHVSPQEFVDTSHDSLFSNSYSGTSACDAAPHQSFLTSSTELGLLGNSPSLNNIHPMTSQSYSATRSHSSYSYLTNTSDNVSSVPNHSSLVNTSSHSYLQLSSATLNSYVSPLGDCLPGHSEPISMSPSSSPFLTTSMDLSPDFMTHNSAGDQVSCPASLQSSILLPNVEHIPPHL